MTSAGTLSGVARADSEKDPQQVAAMFDDVAAKYDRTNTLLSFGQDRRWRRLSVRALGADPGDLVLDVAAGTGVSTAAIRETGAWAVALDFSRGMLAAGARRQVPMVHADALHLPFADATFDAVTISFGLRNIVDVSAGLVEFARVTKPGGRLVVCEFSQPSRPYRWFYLPYLTYVLPRLARRFSSNGPAYRYLAETIQTWPAQRELATMIRDAGWEQVAWRNLTFGTVALHRAVRAGSPQVTAASSATGE